MPNPLKQAVQVLAHGYILFFYSERVFWSFLRPGDRLHELVLGWLVYSLLALVFLWSIRRFRAASFAAVFVAGAVFGWLAEGLVVDTMYGTKENPFPISISFTGLAWHALISVGIGWYAQAKVLATGKPKAIARFSALVGLGWGLWAGWWPAELERANTSMADFSAHAIVCSLLLCGSWIVLALGHANEFRIRTTGAAMVLGLVVLFFVAARIPATPRSALILPPLLLLCFYALRKNSVREQRPDVLESTFGEIRPHSCWLLLWMPVAAMATYAPVAIFGWTLPTNWLLYLMTTPLGFLLLGRSVWRLIRPAHHASEK